MSTRYFKFWSIIYFKKYYIYCDARKFLAPFMTKVFDFFDIYLLLPLHLILMTTIISSPAALTSTSLVKTPSSAPAIIKGGSSWEISVFCLKNISPAFKGGSSWQWEIFVFFDQLYVQLLYDLSLDKTPSSALKILQR